MFGRISIVVHGHFSFLKAHSSNPATTPVLNNTSARGSKDSTPFTRTPEQTKKLSETSTTSGWLGVKGVIKETLELILDELFRLLMSDRNYNNGKKSLSLHEYFSQKSSANSIAAVFL